MLEESNLARAQSLSVLAIAVAYMCESPLEREAFRKNVGRYERSKVTEIGSGVSRDHMRVCVTYIGPSQR